MIFFYNFQGRAKNFRMWKGRSIDEALLYMNRYGPLSFKDSVNAIAYYNFEGTS